MQRRLVIHNERRDIVEYVMTNDPTAECVIIRYVPDLVGFPKTCVPSFLYLQEMILCGLPSFTSMPSFTFTNLYELRLAELPHLKRMDGEYPCLEELTISQCNQLETIPKIFPNLKEFIMNGCAQFINSPDLHLPALQDYSVTGMSGLPILHNSRRGSKYDLSISYCPALMNITDLDLSRIKCLSIGSCQNFVFDRPLPRRSHPQLQMQLSYLMPTPTGPLVDELYELYLVEHGYKAPRFWHWSHKSVVLGHPLNQAIWTTLLSHMRFKVHIQHDIWTLIFSFFHVSQFCSLKNDCHNISLGYSRIYQVLANLHNERMYTLNE
jgi:hypothetical protein